MALFSVFLLILQWVLILAVWPRERQIADSEKISPNTTLAKQVDNESRGRFETHTFMLTRPDEEAAYYDQALIKRPWYFKDSAANVGRFFESLELPKAARTWLLDTSNWSFAEGLISLDVPREINLEITAETRAQLAERLSQLPENESFQFPYIFPTERIEDWFQDMDARPEIVAMTRSLLYRRGGSACLSDAATPGEALAPEEKRRFVRSLSRIRVARIQLNLDPGIDFTTVLEYWSTKETVRGLEPLLRSISTDSQGGGIDAAMLLPPFAREFVYSFPDEEYDPEVLRKDCFWTSIRFHYPNIEGDPAFFEAKHCMQFIEQNYRKISGEPHFGDVLLLYDPESLDVMHACVYIADDVVFTKNGVSVRQPWALMKIDDMMAYYRVFKNPSKLWVRPKNDS